MADEIVVAGAEEIVKRLISLGIDEIALLRGVKEEVDKLQTVLAHIQLVLQDAEKKQVTDDSVRLWLEKLKEAAYDAEDILAEYAYDGLRRQVFAKRKVHNFFSCFTTLPLNFKTAHSIQNITKRLKDIDEQKDSFRFNKITGENVTSNNVSSRETSSLVDELDVVGRVPDKATIVDKLIQGTGSNDPAGSSSATSTLSIITIHGLGGLGKTTLAQLVFNDRSVKEHFGSMMIWVCLSEDFAITTIWFKILKEIGSSNQSESWSKQELQKNLEKELSGKKLLVVLDDFWAKDLNKWAELILPLKLYGASGSKVVVTTREEIVASTVESNYTHPLLLLLDDQCQRLFESKAFPQGEPKNPKLVEIGKQIVKRCGGVPLALKVLGGLMRSKKTEHEWLAIRDVEIWDSSADMQKQVIEILKLSYNNLPLKVRQCFSYCSIFPKDYEIEKHEVVQLWMAQGFLQISKESELMEDLGEEIIRILCMISFFQIVDERGEGTILTYKMHDLVHDVAQYLSRFECKNVVDAKDDNIKKNIRHLSLISSEESAIQIPKCIDKMKRLRTYYTFNYGRCDRLKMMSSLPKLLQLRFLRVLNLRYLPLKEMPSSIGGLKLLKYLSLRWSKIERLPSTICNLYNLQTFDLSYCGNLFELPRSIGTLTQLRHFYTHRPIGNLESPRGLNELHFLRTLDVLKLCGRSASEHVAELEHLNYLVGTLRLENLGDLNDVEAVKKANFMGKKNMNALKMDWGSSTERNDVSCYAELLEAFQPHSNLKKLKIYQFQGWKLPGWMTDDFALPNLVKLQLRDCHKCKELKSFGKLSSLKELIVERMDCLSRIGEDDYSHLVAESSVVEGPEAVATLYPCLEKLRLRDVPNLEEWFEKSVNIFPKLENLKMRGCPKLRIMPNMPPSLKCLTLEKVNNIEAVRSLTDNITSLTFLKLVGPFESEEEVARVVAKNKLLKCLKLKGLPSMMCLEDLSGLQLLEELYIFDCKGLETTRPHFSHSLQKLDITHNMHLRSIRIHRCPQFQGFLSSNEEYVGCLARLSLVACPSIVRLQLHGFTQLQNLTIYGCTGLQSLEGLQFLCNIRDLMIGPFSEDLNQFPFLDSPLISSLLCIHIIGWSRLKSLPEQIQHLSGLKLLYIYDFDGMTELPEWLGCLTSLQVLSIERCKELVHLPTANEMQKLTSLRELTIWNCPLLKGRCKPPKIKSSGLGAGSEWHKISHIPQVDIGPEEDTEEEGDARSSFSSLANKICSKVC